MSKLLVIDDNNEQCDLIKNAFRLYDASIELLTVNSAEEGLEHLLDEDIEAVFIDYVLKGMDGIQFIKELGNRGIKVPTILITGMGDEKTAVEAMKSGASDYVVKTSGYFHALPHIHRMAMVRFRYEREIQRRQEQIEIINALIKAMNSDLSVEHTLSTLIDGGIILQSANAGSFLLIEGGAPRYMCQRNIDLAGRLPWDFAAGVKGAKAVNDVDLLPEGLRECGIKNLICTPVDIMNDKKGVVFIFSFYRRTFSESDITSFEILMDAGASALRNSFLFETIAKSKKLWQDTFDAISDYVFIVGDDDGMIKCNTAFAESCGLHPKDIIGKKCPVLEKGPAYGLFKEEEIHKQKTTYNREMTLGDKTYLASGFPVTIPDSGKATVHILKDITEMRRLKDQLYHSDKLSSLGMLVSGVAHEINNPLTGILGYTELLQMKSKDDTLKKELGKIYAAAERCKAIVENLLLFSRQRPHQRSLEDINNIIEKTVELRIYGLNANNIFVEKDFSDVPYAVLDPQQIQQVILNMLTNAEYAIKQVINDKKGHIKFATKHIPDNGMICIEITDNGIGIDDSALKKIFDPFYSTKPIDKGTGLGLSISHGIISNHGGEIDVESKKGEYTKFIVKLPVSDGRSNTGPDK